MKRFKSVLFIIISVILFTLPLLIHLKQVNGCGSGSAYACVGNTAYMLYGLCSGGGSLVDLGNCSGGGGCHMTASGGCACQDGADVNQCNPPDDPDLNGGTGPTPGGHVLGHIFIDANDNGQIDASFTGDTITAINGDTLANGVNLTCANYGSCGANCSGPISGLFPQIGPLSVPFNSDCTSSPSMANIYPGYKTIYYTSGSWVQIHLQVPANYLWTNVIPRNGTVTCQAPVYAPDGSGGLDYVMCNFNAGGENYLDFLIKPVANAPPTLWIQPPTTPEGYLQPATSTGLGFGGTGFYDFSYYPNDANGNGFFWQIFAKRDGNPTEVYSSNNFSNTTQPWACPLTYSASGDTEDVKYQFTCRAGDTNGAWCYGRGDNPTGNVIPYCDATRDTYDVWCRFRHTFCDNELIDPANPSSGVSDLILNNYIDGNGSNTIVQDGAISVTNNANRKTNKFEYVIYNMDDLYGPGDPRNVCVPVGSTFSVTRGGRTLAQVDTIQQPPCAAGYRPLVYQRSYGSDENDGSMVDGPFDFLYSELFQPSNTTDGGFTTPTHIRISPLYKISNWPTSLSSTQCTKDLSVIEAPYGNIIAQGVITDSTDCSVIQSLASNEDNILQGVQYTLTQDSGAIHNLDQKLGGKPEWDGMPNYDYSIPPPVQFLYSVSAIPPANYAPSINNCPTIPSFPAGCHTGDCNSDLNFYFSFKSAGPWGQTRGGDVYVNGELKSPIPISQDGPPATKQLLKFSDITGTAGVINTKIDASNIPDFSWEINSRGIGSGTDNYISSSGWLVDDNITTSPVSSLFEWFNTHLPNKSIITQESQIDITDSGIYYLDASSAPGETLDLSTTWPSNPIWTKITLLVKGNVKINNKINISSGGFFAIIASGNITIDSSLTSDPLAPSPVLEGIYISGDTIKVEGVSGTPSQFYGRGSFIAKDFSLNRTLDTDNVNHPAVLFEFNPELIINMPPELNQMFVAWQETAP
jgi:hypothetical protein